MKALSESRPLRFVTFGALYLAQGIPWGFVSVGFTIFLADQGLNNEEIGKAAGLAYFPWTYKFIWGPLLDRFSNSRFGRRRPFVIGAQLLMGLSLFLLLFPDRSEQLSWLIFLVFLHNVFASMQDVSVDAMAVDLLREDERASANSVMWAGKSVGIALGGGGGTYLTAHVGWGGLFVVMALSIWIVMLLPILLRERPLGDLPPPRPAGSELARWKAELGEVWRSFSFQAPIVGFLIALLVPFGYALVMVPFTRLMRVDLALSTDEIGFIRGIIDPVTGVLGALIGGVLADRLGVKRVMVGSALAIAATLLGFGVLLESRGGFTLVAVYGGLHHFAMMAYGAASLGFFMSLSNPKVGATQFAFLMAGTNICYTLAPQLGGWLADARGYTDLWLVAALAQAVAVVLIPFASLEQAKARFRPEELDPRSRPDDLPGAFGKAATDGGGGPGSA